jgi:hypothetical protein
LARSLFAKIKKIKKKKKNLPKPPRAVPQTTSVVARVPGFARGGSIARLRTSAEALFPQASRPAQEAIAQDRFSKKKKSNFPAASPGRCTPDELRARARACLLPSEPISHSLFSLNSKKKKQK